MVALTKCLVQHAALVLEVNGEEYVKYNEVYGEAAIPRKQTNKLMADRVTLCDGREAFAPGEYVFPFTYQLGPALPGAFTLTVATRARFVTSTRR